MALVEGIDVSRYQTVTSWDSVRDGGYRYVIVKATEGSTYTSKTFFPYYRDARRADLIVGSYHFARPGNSSGRAQARWYVEQLKRADFESGRDLPPVLDIEDAGGKNRSELTSWCLDFVHEVDRLLDLDEPWLRCGFYCNNDYRHNRMNGDRVHSGRWLWLAYWPSGQGQPREEEMPEGAAIWQWTDGGNVPGIRENTDLDVVRQTDLARLAPGRDRDPIRRHYASRRPLQIPPGEDSKPGWRYLQWEIEWADPRPSSHAPEGASYVRKTNTGWSSHELSGLRIDGMQPGDTYQVQIALLDRRGDDVLWTSVLEEGAATTGNQYVSVQRSLRTDVGERVRWRVLYYGTQPEVQVSRADWLIEEY